MPSSTPPTAPGVAAAALAVPWQTSYVCRTLMAVTGVAYALRGFEVRWSLPTMRGDTEAGASRSPAQLVYLCFQEKFRERAPSHSVEISCLFPRSAVLAEYRVRQACSRLAAVLA